MSDTHMSKATSETKKKTIVFRQVVAYELDYDEWYSNKKRDFKTEADAVAQWDAMCEGTGGEHEMDGDDRYGYDDIEECCDEVQENYSTANYDEEMALVIDLAVKAFDSLGVEFYKDHTCCNTCGHAEAECENYVFYHSQNTEDLRKGARSVHLAFNFDAEHKEKVLKMIEKQTETGHYHLYWNGEEHTKLFLTCDEAEMEKYIKEDLMREERIKNTKATKK
tara:strand:- start:1832 stop:2497 length:666 start_codon:yes stop_codon:yes gene_type:complete